MRVRKADVNKIYVMALKPNRIPNALICSGTFAGRKIQTLVDILASICTGSVRCGRWENPN